MTIYYPYVLIETNVDPRFLKYTIYIYNSRTNKDVACLVDHAFKKINNQLYQTRFIEFDTSRFNAKDILDYVIVFSLYRVTRQNKGKTVIRREIIPNKISFYISKNHNQNQNINKLKYKEVIQGTQVVRVEHSQNVALIELNRNRIFQCIDPDCKPGEKGDPFTKEQIEAGLQARLNNPSPDQYLSSLCGPAAYFFCLINLSPSTYKMIVKGLWETGQAKLGDLTIKPTPDGCRRVQNFYRKNKEAKVPPIDWITLASLRESENKLLIINDPDQEVSGVTMWSGMLDWIKKSGFTVAKEWSIDLAGYNWSVINEINTYAGSNHYIVTLASASMLDGGSSSGTTLIPDHWIVWTDKLRDVQGKPITSKSDPWTYVSLKLFSWGKDQQQVKSTIQLASFCRRIYFAVAIKKDHF